MATSSAFSNLEGQGTHAGSVVQQSAVQKDGFRETMESIVVALILAFVFRAFIVEAFVIPTGSMAPTLNGAHGTMTCEDCGYEFAYGLRDLNEGRRGYGTVVASSEAICPNCSYPNTDLKINDQSRNAESGDRILVLKWPYDIGGSWLGPARWDVSVFKNPADGKENYIKRLIGLPHEVLMIVDGDVYTVSVKDLSPETMRTLEAQRHRKYELRAGLSHGLLRPLPQSVFHELDKKLRISRKTREAQKALWFVVYDHDFKPRSVESYQPRWEASLGSQSGWNTSERHIPFTPRTDESDYIELVGKPIEADYAYNIPSLQMRRSFDAVPVSDLRVDFVYTPRSADSVVRVCLTPNRRVFWVSVYGDGRVTITESQEEPTEDVPPMVQGRIAPLNVTTPYEISFENVDYRLAVYVRGEEIATSSSNPDDPAYYGPDLFKLRHQSPHYSAPPRLYGRGGPFEVAHLVVSRDVYYYNVRISLNWSALDGWGTTDNPILLREGEYFMLGDNSPASQDSRLWTDISKNHYLVERGEAFQLGTVPRDQMIGKAFFVYWPAAHRVPWLPLPRDWGIIPDVGHMRWIR